MQVSILLVSESEGLSRTRALLLRQWNVLSLTPGSVPGALDAKRHDLVIICQTVLEAKAVEVAAMVRDRWPGGNVMAINGHGERRTFESLQFEVDLSHPEWLPSAVAGILASEKPVHE